MDAEHRHELKTNELATWLAHLPDWIKQNTNYIIGIALIVIGLITWPMLNRMAEQKDISQQTETTNSIQMLENDIRKAATPNAEDPQAQQQALSMLLVNADTLLEKASDIENPNLAAIARIKAAQAIRTELQLRPEQVPAETVETQIKKAADVYQKAFDGAQDPQVKALAKLGLGLCSEELGQTEQAASIYNELVKDEAYAATVVPAQAQTRLDVLAEKTGPVYFAPAPAPAAEAPAVVEGAAPVEMPSIEAAPAERQSAAEAEEMPQAAPAPAQPQAQPAPAPQPAPAEQPAQAPAPAPAEQNATPNE